MRKTTFVCLLIIGSLFACETKKSATETTEAAKDTAMDHSAMADMKHEEHPRDLKFVSYVDSVNNGLVANDTLKTSARREATGTVGGVTVKINYGSPGVRGRNIWNGLVAYNEVWVTGAHTATAVTFDKDVTVNGQKIPAGTYAFFTIPNEKEWTVILNKNPEQHLADSYSEKEDVIRLQAKPETNSKIIQRLTYEVVKKSDTEGAITVMWEKVKVSLPFKAS
jgi:hypothetical protein